MPTTFKRGRSSYYDKWQRYFPTYSWSSSEFHTSFKWTTFSPVRISCSSGNQTKICFQEFFHFHEKNIFYHKFWNFQNAYMGEAVEEPEFQYVPDTPHVSPLVPGTQAVSMSMHLLGKRLKKIGLFQDTYWLLFGLYQVFYISLITPLSIIFSFTNFRRIIGFRSYLWPIWTII